MSNRRKIRQSAPKPRSGGVVLAYIHPGEVSSYFLESMLTTTLTDVGREMAGERPRIIRNILQEWSSANVSAARNTLTQRFLDRPDGDWLLWVDADMQWEPDAIEQLLAAADPETRPIVGGLCFGMSKGGLFPTIYQWAEIDGQFTTVRVRDYPRDALVRCAATGAAFLLIHRRVLESMTARQFDRAFPYFQESSGNGAPVGEDLTFCIRAGILGFPVHVLTGVRIGHHKSHLLTEELFDQQAPAGLPADVGLTIPTRGDHPELLRAIVATSGLPPERVAIIDTTDMPINIHRWWNAGIDLLAERGCTRVAVLNDDVSIAPDTLPRMVRAMGGATLALTGVDGPSGHCFVLNTAHGVRPDESYRWYSGDLQLIADAQQAGGVVRVDDAWCLHLHPAEATGASHELVALAAADDALYDTRHPAGSRFAAVRKV